MNSLDRNPSPVKSDVPTRWRISKSRGYLTLIESRDGPNGYWDNDVETEIQLGHVSGDPESEVPPGYRRGHPIFREIERMSEEYLDAIFGDEYRDEHTYTYRQGQGGES